MSLSLLLQKFKPQKKLWMLLNPNSTVTHFQSFHAFRKAIVINHLRAFLQLQNISPIYWSWMELLQNVPHAILLCVSPFGKKVNWNYSPNCPTCGAGDTSKASLYQQQRMKKNSSAPERKMWDKISGRYWCVSVSTIFLGINSGSILKPTKNLFVPEINTLLISVTR